MLTSIKAKSDCTLSVLTEVKNISPGRSKQLVAKYLYLQ